MEDPHADRLRGMGPVFWDRNTETPETVGHFLLILHDERRTDASQLADKKSTPVTRRFQLRYTSE